MRSKRGINWVFSLFDRGNQGIDFEVIEALQPVVDVNNFEFPPLYQGMQPLVIALIAGTVTTPLPVPSDPLLNRFWLSIQSSRSNPAVGDRDVLVRQTANVGIVISTQAMDGTIPANLTFNHVGGNVTRSVVGGTGMFSQGRLPILATKEAPLNFISTAVAAVGTVALSGLFIDIPVQMPLPVPFLA